LKAKDIILYGELPVLAVFICAAAAFYLGQSWEKPEPIKFAVAEKAAVVIQAVLDNPNLTNEQNQAQIVDPIRGVLKKYADQGYAVIESSRDENGNHAIAALPANSINITSELKEAIQKAKSTSGESK